MNKRKGWIEKKCKDPNFKKLFEEEVGKISIGEQLIQIRLEADLTQKQLAEKIGTTASAISRYENADYDRYEINTIRRIVNACGGKLEIKIKRVA